MKKKKIISTLITSAIVAGSLAFSSFACLTCDYKAAFDDDYLREPAKTKFIDISGEFSSANHQPILSVRFFKDSSLKTAYADGEMLPADTYIYYAICIKTGYKITAIRFECSYADNEKIRLSESVSEIKVDFRYYVMGDVDFDGKVTPLDVKEMLTAVVTDERLTHWDEEDISKHEAVSKLNTRLYRKTGDIDGDGKADVWDISLLLKYLAEWDVIPSTNSPETNGSITVMSSYDGDVVIYASARATYSGPPESTVVTSYEEAKTFSLDLAAGTVPTTSILEGVSENPPLLYDEYNRDKFLERFDETFLRLTHSFT